MSEDNKNNSSSAAAESASQQNQQEQEAFVSKKAYEEVSKDMHRFKQKAKELEATVNEFQAQLKAQEEQKMQEQEQWKELYQKREAELEQVRKDAEDKQRRYLNSVKMSALKQELGANVRDEYLRFASLDAININEDGSIDRDSLREAANSFRKEHGQLIPTSENVNITGQAASSTNVSKPVDIGKMSSRELLEYYANLKNQ